MANLISYETDEVQGVGVATAQQAQGQRGNLKHLGRNPNYWPGQEFYLRWTVRFKDALPAEKSLFGPYPDPKHCLKHFYLWLLSHLFTVYCTVSLLSLFPIFTA